jgi:hypothetical protein
MKKKAYILIAVGLFFLSRNLGWFDSVIQSITDRLYIDLGEYWPFILIFLGIYLLFTSRK